LLFINVLVTMPTAVLSPAVKTFREVNGACRLEIMSRNF